MMIKLAKKIQRLSYEWREFPINSPQLRINELAEQLAQAVIDNNQAVATWIIKNGYATGHGDTIEDMLDEVKQQIEEQGMEEAAKIVQRDAEYYKTRMFSSASFASLVLQEAEGKIRARIKG